MVWSESVGQDAALGASCTSSANSVSLVLGDVDSLAEMTLTGCSALLAGTASSLLSLATPT
jgi:hypothetical protein